MQKLLCLVGPTAIGKTQTALTLAQKFNCEIVSGDSMQVYRELAIGTAAPTPAERAQVPHHLVACQSVYQPYDVHDFVAQAQAAIVGISQQKKLPLLVGGTGFYAKALLYDLQLGGKQEQANDPALAKELAANGPQTLWAKLNNLDQAAAAKIPWQNARRTLRALTVIKNTGQLFSQQQAKIQPRYDFLILGLNTERAVLYDRINRRVDLMLQQGLLEEARFVYEQRAQLYQAKQAIGYKEFFPYFEKKAPLSACVAKLKQASRRYAKRQLTYFRHQLPVQWFDPIADPAFMLELTQVVKKWLN